MVPPPPIVTNLSYGLDIYFAYPGRPWEASSENTNGLLRRSFPKRTDLSIHTAEDLRAVEERLNNRPRETLGWRTPPRSSSPAHALTDQAVATTGRIRSGTRPSIQGQPLPVVD